MGTVTRSTEIAAPPDAVWDVLRDVGRLPEFSPSTDAVDVDGDLRDVGQRFDQTVTVAGRRFTSTWEVTELEPGRVLVIDGSVVPGSRYRMIEHLEALADGSGTRLTLTMEYRLPFGPLGRLASRLGVERRAVEEAEEVLAGVRRSAEDATDRGVR